MESTIRSFEIVTAGGDDWAELDKLLLAITSVRHLHISPTMDIPHHDLRLIRFPDVNRLKVAQCPLLDTIQFTLKGIVAPTRRDIEAWLCVCLSGVAHLPRSLRALRFGLLEFPTQLGPMSTSIGAELEATEADWKRIQRSLLELPHHTRIEFVSAVTAGEQPLVHDGIVAAFILARLPDFVEQGRLSVFEHESLTPGDLAQPVP
ncbi:hypothetical protein OH76DRAFT_883804 [Lentinus brumalis]|uniref:Uncharacterized protein n=1 Tax=Lentinus brumalis TaxID=2498619 RepID=A0A371D1B1_9APHY|nr:hypothetical protein OH76DRAFT_883804 [Polyporus brumalis]